MISSVFFTNYIHIYISSLSYEDQQAYLNDLLEECDEDEEVLDFVGDSSEDEWLPAAANRNAEDSDIEDVYEDHEVRIEVSDEEIFSDSEVEEEDGTVSDNIINSPFLKGKDGTIWRQTPPQRQTLRHNILRSQRTGPLRSTEMLPVKDTFKCIFSDVMCEIIIRQTNRKGNEVYATHNFINPEKPPKKWKLLTEKEFDAYLAILINAGVHQSNNEHTKMLWATTSNPLYRASMGLNRFWEISRFLRFDNQNTRQFRLQTDKAAAISEIFELLNENLRKYYTPSECVVVDEQLFPYRGIYRDIRYYILQILKKMFLCRANKIHPVHAVQTGQIWDQSLVGLRCC